MTTAQPEEDTGDSAATHDPAKTEKTKANNEPPISHHADEYSAFSPTMRVYMTYHLGLVMLISTMTTTIYSPLIPFLSRQFNVSIQAINTTVTVYAILQAVSPAIFSSMADSFGRRPVLLGIITLYACASLGLAVNKSNYGVLLGLRALQSIGGSATVPISYGIVADMAVVSQRGKMLGPMLSICNAICAVGTVIGGALALGTGGHQWVFLTLLIISLVLVVSTGFTLPETGRNVVGNGLKPAHGIWRTWWSFLRERTRPRCEHVGGASRETLGPDMKLSWLPIDAFAPVRILFYRDAAAVLWMISTSYSVFYTFQTAIPIGLSLLPVFAGLTIGGIFAGKLLDKNYTKVAGNCNITINRETHDDIDNFPLEIARYRGCMPFLLLEVALIAGYGWAVQFKVHPAVPLILHFFICATSTILTHTSNALLVDMFPKIPSTAYASGQLARCGFSAASVAVLQPIIEAVGRGWYFTIFALFLGISGLMSVSISRSRGMQWRQERQKTHETQQTHTDEGPDPSVPIPAILSENAEPAGPTKAL